MSMTLNFKITADAGQATKEIVGVQDSLGRLHTTASTPMDSGLKSLEAAARQASSVVPALGRELQQAGSAGTAGLKATALEVEALRLKFDPAYAAAKRLTSQTQELNTALAAGVITQQRYAELMRDLQQASSSGSAGLKAAAAEVEALRLKFDPAYAAAQRLAAQTKELNTALAAGAITQQRYAELMRDLQQASSSGSAGLKAAAAEVEALRLKFDPAYAAAQRLTAQTQELNTALASGAITQQRHAELMGQMTRASASAGASLGQISQATRQLPMQMQDVFVSLQGGMSPLTVFMQQGSQIAGSYGSAGLALRRVGTYLMGMINPLTLAAAAVGSLGLAYFQGSKEADAYRLALINTGNAAGTSAAQMADMARSMDSAWGVTQGAAAEALAAMAATGRVGSASLQGYAQVAIDMEKSFGVSIADTAKHFGELGKDPVGASARLNESMNYLTASTYAQIKAAAENGDAAKAAALAQDAYAKAMKARAAEVVANLGYMERAWAGIKNAAKETWDAMLGVGRSSTPGDALAKATKQLADREASLKEHGNRGGLFGDDTATQVAKLKDQVYGLQELERMQKRAGAAAAEKAAAEKASIAAIDAVAKANEAALSKQDQMTKALSDYRKALKDLPADQQQSAEQIAKAEAAIREKFKEAAPKKTEAETLAKQQAKAYAELVSAMEGKVDAARLEAAQTEKLTEAQKQQLAIEKMVKDGKISARDASSAKTVALIAEMKAAEELKRTEAFRKAQADADDKALESLHKEVEAIRKASAAMVLHNEEIGLTAKQLNALRLARIDDEIAVQAGIVAEYDEARARGEVSAQMQLQINKLDELKKKRGLTEEGQQAQVAATAAKKAADEWKRAADQIESSLTDALMRGFESGKSFGQNLLDSIKNLFKTLILRPQIQAIVTGGMGALGLGLPGQAMAQTGLGGMMSSGISAMGLTGVGAAFGSTLATGFVSTLTGSMAPALTAAGSMIGAGTATSIAGGLGLAAGAIAPYALALGAVVSLAKKLDTSGTIHTGGGASYSAAAGVQTDISRTGFGGVNRRAETETMAAGMAQSIVGLLDSTATAFGKTAGYTAATAFADDSSKDGAWGALVLSKGGKNLLNWNDSRQSRWAPKEFANGEEGVKQYMAAVGKDVRDMLVAETPAWADAMLQALGDAPTLEQLGGVVQQITAIQNIFTQFGQAMPQLAGLSDDAVGSLMALSGGVANLQQGLGAYMDRFYSDAEKQTLATRNMQDAMAKLGMTMPATNAEFRALVEAQDLNTESGRQHYAALIALAPAFDQVTSAAQKSADAAIQEAAAKAKAAADQRASLQDQLDQLTGNTAAIKARARAAVDASNLTLYDQIQALTDAKAAQEAYTASLESAQSALASATAAVASAQQTVDGIRGQATQGYLSALEQVAQIQGQIADQARQTASTYRDLAKQLREYVTGVVVPPSDAFAKALTKALGGDQAAMASLPGLAGTATDAAREGAASAAEFRLAQGRILAGVNAAADKAAAMGVETPAQKAATLQQKLIDAQNQLAEATRVANAINAPLAQTQATLITQYQSALQTLATAQAAAAKAQATLDAIRLNTLASSDRIMGMWSAVVSGFAAMDISQDGLLSSAEFAKGMAGKATDSELQSLFKLLDSNGDGQLTYLEAVAKNTLTSSDRITGVWAALVSGFSAMDISQDGLLSSAEFTKGMAGKATDGELQSLFKMLDINGDGQLTYLEAVVKNTALIAQRVGSGTASAIANTTTGMTQADFGAALRAEAAKQGLAASSITSSFISGQFSQLDKNNSGLLESAEAAGSASAIASAVSNLLASQSAAAGGGSGSGGAGGAGAGGSAVPAAAVLTARDKEILADPRWKEAPRPSTSYGSQIYDMYQKHVLRRPEVEGLAYWTKIYEDGIKQYGSQAAPQILTNIDAGIKAARIDLKISTVADAKKVITDWYLGQGGSLAGVNAALPRFFAKGGAFEDGVVSTPTAFPLGVMGEAGPEAIMPLSRGPNGALGVAMHGGGQHQQALIQEVRALRDALRDELTRLRAETRAGASAAQEHLQLDRRLTRNGRSVPVEGVQGEPLQVIEVTA